MLREMETKEKYSVAIYNLACITQDKEEREELMKKYYIEKDNVKRLKIEIKSTIRYSILDVITDIVYERILDDYK